MLTLDFEEIPGIDVIAGELVPRYRPSAHARQYR
ncbi:MAG: hypothetical protein K0R60_1973 [Microbacterium sp.]|nr:hypothetical protein [Microbacterium sp.]